MKGTMEAHSLVAFFVPGGENDWNENSEVEEEVVTVLLLGLRLLRLLRLFSNARSFSRKLVLQRPAMMSQRDEKRPYSDTYESIVEVKRDYHVLGLHIRLPAMEVPSALRNKIGRNVETRLRHPTPHSVQVVLFDLDDATCKYLAR
jgi:hypothetical protein